MTIIALALAVALAWREVTRPKRVDMRELLNDFVAEIESIDRVRLEDEVGRLEAEIAALKSQVSA